MLAEPSRDRHSVSKERIRVGRHQLGLMGLLHFEGQVQLFGPHCRRRNRVVSSKLRLAAVDTF